jgi:hypothetical protein
VVQSSDGRKWILLSRTIPNLVGEKPLIIAFSALTTEEWEEVLDAADPEDLPRLRRLRKLAVHRLWRLRHRDEEAERHRQFYETKKARAKKARESRPSPTRRLPKPKVEASAIEESNSRKPAEKKARAR